MTEKYPQTKKKILYTNEMLPIYFSRQHIKLIKISGSPVNVSTRRNIPNLNTLITSANARIFNTSMQTSMQGKEKSLIKKPPFKKRVLRLRTLLLKAVPLTVLKAVLSLNVSTLYNYCQ